ncbi:TraR/DksA C4-type zinc finger protein [Kineococcus endophyticus]|uniref:TraR/DksA C4-type zinc finger protein n=1 Tax=Kineococcus endophyticus TaxID=1181883 RepID=A0ABV3PDN0_9ACTN
MTATTHHTDHDHLRTALEETRDDRRVLLQSITAEELLAAETDPVIAASIGSARRILQEVEEALARMDAGEFGFCVHCRRPIPAGRLEFLPHASGCVPCLQSQRRA